MGALARLACLALAGLGLTLMACGQSRPGAGEPWAPGPPDRSVVPVLLVEPQSFAAHMALLDRSGYSTITLDDFLRFVRRKQVDLPPHPLLVTLDGGREDTWRGADEALQRLGMHATLFVDVGRVEADDTWDELADLARSGRWDVQLQSGTGNRLIRFGPAPDDVGPFYAYRGTEEVLGGWRERVFSDITYGEEQLAFHVEGYRPLAIAPPHGNYGQAGSNDPHIARELRARLLDSFELIFTQDRSGLARPGAGNPLGRIEVTRDVTGEELHGLITSEEGQR